MVNNVKKKQIIKKAKFNYKKKQDLEYKESFSSKHEIY